MDKLPKWQDRFGLPTGLLATVDHDLHRIRRSALNPYFSKRKINEFTPYIQQCAERLCTRLLSEYKETSRVVNLNNAWGAFATDNIMYFCFAWSYDNLNCPDFVALFTNSLRGLAYMTHIAGHFPVVLRLLPSFPEAVVEVLNPAMRPVLQCHSVGLHDSLHYVLLNLNSLVSRRSDHKYSR